MTEQDVIQVLHLLRANYPKTFSGMSKDDEAEYINLWKIMLKNDDTREIKTAVMWIINNDTREFAPNIGQVRNAVAKLKLKNHNEKNNINVEDDWNEAYKSLQKISWNVTLDHRIYDKFNYRIKRALTFDEWYQMAFDTRANNFQYKKPKFIKAWNQSQAEIFNNLLENNHASAYEKLGIGFAEEHHELMLERKEEEND